MVRLRTGEENGAMISLRCDEYGIHCLVGIHWDDWNDGMRVQRELP